jgi:hypothetical protein
MEAGTEADRVAARAAARVLNARAAASKEVEGGPDRAALWRVSNAATAVSRV